MTSFWLQTMVRLSAVDGPPSLQAAVAGIEPAKGRLTAACPYQHGPHRMNVFLLGPARRWYFPKRSVPVRVGPDGVEPSSCTYKERALTIELRAAKIRDADRSATGLNEAGGTRTPTVQIKRLLCCHYTTTPDECGMWVSVCIDEYVTWLCLPATAKNK